MQVLFSWAFTAQLLSLDFGLDPFSCQEVQKLLVLFLFIGFFIPIFFFIFLIFFFFRFTVLVCPHHIDVGLSLSVVKGLLLSG